MGIRKAKRETQFPQEAQIGVNEHSKNLNFDCLMKAFFVERKYANYSFNYVIHSTKLLNRYNEERYLSQSVSEMFHSLQKDSNKCASQYELSRFVTMATYCVPDQYSASKLYKLVPRPICSWDRCISDSLDKPEGLQFSPFLNDMSLSGKDPKGSGDNCPDHTNVACTSVVPSPSRDVLQTANSAAPSEQSVAFPQPAATPSSSAGPPVISGLDGYRQNLLADGISEQTSNSAWKQWNSWCRQRKIDPFCSSVASVAEYLTELLKQGKSYCTINSHSY